jgi:hypothetical protein
LLIIAKGGTRILNYHNGSHIKALIKLYPELMLKKENFNYKVRFFFSTHFFLTCLIFRRNIMIKELHRFKEVDNFFLWKEVIEVHKSSVQDDSIRSSIIQRMNFQGRRRLESWFESHCC